jgi:TonB family protein
MADSHDFPLILSFSISVGGQDGGTHEIEQEMVTIGKGGAAVLQLDDPALADLHCAVQLGDDGVVTVLDLGSETGTLLNGKPVNNSPVKDGDEIRLGNTQIKLGIRRAKPAAAALAGAAAAGPGQAAGASAAPSASLSAAAQVGRSNVLDLSLAEPEKVIDAVVWSSKDQGGGVSDQMSPRVLQVAEVWFNQVMSVRHFGPETRKIHVGDKVPHVMRVVSSLIVVLMLAGVALFAAQTNRIVEPPHLPAGDAELTAQWKAEADAQRRRLAEEQQQKAADELAALEAAAAEKKMTLEDYKAEQKKLKAEEAEKGPKDPYVEMEEAFNEKSKNEFDKASKANPKRFFQLPIFELYEQPDYEALMKDKLLPWARERAPRGELDKFWIDALKQWTKTYDIYEDPEIPRVAEDLPWGIRVVRDGTPAMVVPGIDPDRVHLADAAWKLTSVVPSEELRLWAPSAQEVADREAVYHEVQGLLYAQAKARRSRAAMCDVLGNLLEFPDEKDRFDMNAIYGTCLADQDKWDEAREFVARAMERRPSGELSDDDALLVLNTLQSAAMLKMRDGWGGDPFLEDPELVPAEKWDPAKASVEELRSFITARAHDPQALLKADALLHRLDLQKMREAHAAIIRKAMWTCAILLLLLPLGIGIDQIRIRGSAQDFFVPENTVPNNHFPMVEQNGGVKLNITRDWVGWVDRQGQRTSLSDLIGSGKARDVGGYFQADLADDETAFVDIGNIHFVVARVHRGKVIPTPFREGVDWAFLAILGALLLSGGLLALRMLLVPFEPRQESVEIPDRFVELLIQPVEKQKDKPSGNPDAGEGAKAKKEEGKVGKKESKLKKAKGSKVAVNRAQQDKQIAENAGLLAALNQMDSSVIGGQGLGGEVSNAIGGLIGAVGTQYGSGGLGSRGDGWGGGGNAEGIGGLGTRGTGLGGSGYGRGAGFYGQKGSGGPGVGAGDPIILGALDKSLIDRVVKQHLAAIRYCYEKELAKNPKLFGKIVVKFTIAKDGTVSSASVKSSTMGNPIVEECVAERFMRMRFPAPKGGGIVVVSYPFVFNAAG